jgi:DNA repair ATPase RecN
MSEKPSKDEALEALDFIVNVLKEHEKDLAKLINELGTVAEQLGDSGELSEKVKKIEDKINGLQTEVGILVKSLANPQKNAAPSPKVLPAAFSPKAPEPQMNLTNGVPLMLQCRQWPDFVALANGAQAVSFSCKEVEKAFKVDVLKNNQVISFSGELPKVSLLMKMFLSKQLVVADAKILEGDMTLR